MGFIVGLTGVSGSGKTTTAKLVIKKLKSQGVKATYYHELDLLFLKQFFGVFNNRLIKSKTAENLKKKVFLVTHLLVSTEENKSLLTVYFSLVWLDRIFTYFYFKLRKGIIIFDRWPHDFIAQFQQIYYNNRFIRKLFEIYPKPDIMIFLYPPHQVAYLRKRSDPSHMHLDIEYYRTLQSRTYEIARKYNYNNIINSDRPEDEVADDVLSLIKNFNLATKK